MARPQNNVDLIEEVLNRSVELATGHFDRYQVELVVELPDQPQPVMCDPELLVIALVNLLSNAAKYGREGGQVRLILTHQEYSFAICVWNAGEGFSDEQAQQLFQKFARLDTDSTRKRKGNGVGLYTVRKIAHLHGGDVRVLSKRGEFAEFTIIIPQPLICALPG